MKNAFLSGVKEGLVFHFLAGIIAVVMILGISLAEPFVKLIRDFKLQPNGYLDSIFITSLSSDIFTSFVPIIATLPYGGNFIDGVKSKFVRFYIVRSGYTKYLLSRIFSCFLLGGIVIDIGVVIAYLFCALLILPIELAASEECVLCSKLISHLLTLYLSGGFWALFGMAMSTVMESKYIAYASPFVMYYLLVILHERYFPDLYLIYPKEWMNPSLDWPWGGLGMSFIVFELSTLMGIIFFVRGKRRLEQL